MKTPATTICPTTSRTLYHVASVDMASTSDFDCMICCKDEYLVINDEDQTYGEQYLYVTKEDMERMVERGWIDKPYHMDTPTSSQPIFKHDCDKCKHLGFVSDGKQLFDGYVCNDSLILRKSSDDEDYETRRIRTYRMFADEPLFNTLLQRADKCQESQPKSNPVMQTRFTKVG